MYPSPEHNLTLLVDCNITTNQISFFPGSTFTSYTEALILKLEEYELREV